MILYLSDDGFLRRTTETEKTTEHTKDGEESDKESSTSLRLRLEGIKGILLDVVNEVEDLVADEGNRIVLEGDLIIIFVDTLWCISLVLKGFLDLEGLGGELLGVFDRVSNIQVIEENVLGHGPELNTNTTLQSSLV